MMYMQHCPERLNGPSCERCVCIYCVVVLFDSGSSSGIAGMRNESSSCMIKAFYDRGSP